MPTMIAVFDRVADVALESTMKSVQPLGSGWFGGVPEIVVYAMLAGLLLILVYALSR